MLQMERVRLSTKDKDGTNNVAYVVAERHRVFGLERSERERRDLVDFEGLVWGGPLPLIGLA